MVSKLVVHSRCFTRIVIHRDSVPLGSSKTDWNFNTDHKRVLNEENIVSDDDNIKQDKSIDVYGRFDDEEGEDGKK